MLHLNTVSKVPVSEKIDKILLRTCCVVLKPPYMTALFLDTKLKVCQDLPSGASCSDVSVRLKEKVKT